MLHLTQRQVSPQEFYSELVIVTSNPGQLKTGMGLHQTINPNGLSLLVALAIERPELLLQPPARDWMASLLDEVLGPVLENGEDVFALPELTVQRQYFMRAILYAHGLATCRSWHTFAFRHWGSKAKESIQHILLQHLRQAPVGELVYMLDALPTEDHRANVGQLWKILDGSFRNAVLRLCVDRVPELFLQFGGERFGSDPTAAGFFQQAASSFMMLTPERAQAIANDDRLPQSVRDSLANAFDLERPEPPGDET